VARIRIELLNIECGDTEDFTGADDVYYIHTLKCSSSPGRTDVENPIPLLSRISSSIPINDGEIKRFPLSPRDENVLFDGDCDREFSINGSAYFFDSDGGDISRRLGVDEFVRKVLVPIGFFFSGWLTFDFLREIGPGSLLILLTSPVVIGLFLKPIIMLGIFLLLGLAVQGFLKLIGNIDKDDYLGGFALDVPVFGPPGEQLLVFRLTGSTGITTESGERFSGTSGTVDYTVRALVVR